MIQKYIILLLIFSSLAFAKPVIVVSILPQESFVKKIVKEKMDVITLVERGSSPHSYEPKPSQMKAFSNAALYFTIGVEFEKAWLQRFTSQNPNLQIKDMNRNISYKKMSQAHPHTEKDNGHHHEGLDPHTWTSPKNVAIMARNIYEAVIEIDPNNQLFFQANLREFLSEIDATNAAINKILKDTSNKKFMVFHPSWGYFADAYKLEQLAVEVNGKNPKPKEMIEIIEEAKEHEIRVIFTQPEFSQKSAEIIAKETGAKLYKISPLSPEWSQNLINMANAIATK